MIGHGSEASLTLLDESQIPDIERWYNALLCGMGEVLVLVSPGVDGHRLPSGQGDAAASATRENHGGQRLM